MASKDVGTNAAPPPVVEAVALSRRQLGDAGFRPVALYTNEKRPFGTAWQDRARRTPPEAVDAMPDARALNTGILADGLRIIDIDVEDPAIVARVRTLAVAMFGETIIRTRSNSARCAMLYRAAVGRPVKQAIAGLAGKVEVLGLGQQLHAFGPHPSGATLNWHPKAPGNATADSLPSVTEDAVSAFLAAAASLIGADIPTQAKGNGAHLNGHSSGALDADTDALDVSAALAVIPNAGPRDWDFWNKVGMATWHATGGSMSGFGAWCGWSGRHPNHDSAAVEERWAHYRTSPPTKIGAGTLFHMAREACPDWRKPSEAAADTAQVWLANPDMSVLRLGRRDPPAFPLGVLGRPWGDWARTTAEAAACPVDNVIAPLLSSASVLIGHSRWAQAVPGWAEPPHLWCGVVGDSGTGKSPGADALLRDVLPELEQRMLGDFPDRLAQWRLAAEAHAAALERWKTEVRAAEKGHVAPPMPPAGDVPSEPQAPRLRQNDVTIEKVAALLAGAAPKGLLMVRDELAGWLLGMNAYNDGGRSFWIEAYGGRPYRVERQKNPEPIVVPRLAVGVTGGTQPEKLSALFHGADDGLFGRLNWFWPDPLPFRLCRTAPNTTWAIDALDRLRLLELMMPDEANGIPCPVMVPLNEDGQQTMEVFAQDMQHLQEGAGGLMRSAYGKARGLALRLSLVLEYLWWCGDDGIDPPPTTISEAAFAAAAHLVADYLLPMAERVYGDAATRPEDRNAATMARWIVKTKATEVYVRDMQRVVRLPGLGDAAAIHAAAKVLVDAGWLLPPKPGEFQRRPRAAYAVNQRVLEDHP